MRLSFRLSTGARLRRVATGAGVLLLVAACSGTPAASPAPPDGSVPSASPAPATPIPSASPAPATPTPAAIPTATPAPTSSLSLGAPLSVLTVLVGDETRAVLVTDWNRIRGGAPAPAPTDPAERLALLQSLDSRAPAAVFGIPQFRGHKAAWGWDTLDLAWEASLLGEDGTVIVLGLAPGFELAPVLAHFRDHKFAEEERGPAAVFSRPLDPKDDWF